jgi:hypothetical protein
MSVQQRVSAAMVVDVVIVDLGFRGDVFAQRTRK